MDFINPTLCYQLVILDRACIGADLRTERLKQLTASILLKERSEDVLEAFKVISAESADIIADIKISSQKTATTINDAISQLSMGETGVAVLECVGGVALHMRYVVERFITIDDRLAKLRDLAEL
jgi:hypothetical protein